MWPFLYPHVNKYQKDSKIKCAGSFSIKYASIFAKILGQSWSHAKHQNESEAEHLYGICLENEELPKVRDTLASYQLIGGLVCQNNVAAVKM